MRGVNPVMEQFNAPVVVQVLPSGLEVTVYPVIEEVPGEDGAAQVMDTVVVATHTSVHTVFVALTPLGAPGTPVIAVGVTVDEAVEATLMPTLLVAVTVNV